MFNPLKKVKLLVNAYADMIRKNKGKIDISIMAYSYDGALRCLRRHGIKEYNITVNDKELKINVENHIQDIHNFIKREMLVDVSNK